MVIFLIEIMKSTTESLNINDHEDLIFYNSLSCYARLFIYMLSYYTGSCFLCKFGFISKVMCMGLLQITEMIGTKVSQRPGIIS